jgi:hypothetical protein
VSWGTPPTPAPGEPIRESGGHAFFTGDSGGKLVLGMTTFTPQEGRKLAARIMQVCNRLLRQEPSRARGTQAVSLTFGNPAHENLVREALGYARGQADGTAIPTGGGHVWINPDLAFAHAWADSRISGDYPDPLGKAYETWQDSDGRTVTPS